MFILVLMLMPLIMVIAVYSKFLVIVGFWGIVAFVLAPWIIAFVGCLMRGTSFIKDFIPALFKGIFVARRRAKYRRKASK